MKKFAKNIRLSIFFTVLSSNCYADINFTAVGDIMLANRLSGNITVNPSFLTEVQPILKDSDINFANLEGPIGGDISQRKTCKSTDFCHTFSQTLDSAKYLKYIGFNILSVANNHAQDMGVSGKLSTMETLAAQNINFVGYPEKQFTQLKIKNKIVGFVAFSANSGLPDYRNTEYSKNLISYAKSKSDILVVSMHAGCEGEKWIFPTMIGEEICFGENRGNVINFSKLAVDYGADVVIGHGPHVPRGILFYKNKLVALSLGNFATARGISVTGKTGLAPALKFTIAENGEFKNINIISFKQQFDKGPKLDSNQEAFNLISFLSKKLVGQ